MHELPQSLVEILVDAVRPTWLFLPVRISALDREVDPSVVFDLEDFHVNLLALGEVGVNVLDEIAVNLGDVHETCDVGLKLDECSEVLKPHNLALHDGSWLS